MPIVSKLASVLDLKETLQAKQIIDLILPVKEEGAYTFDEIDNLLGEFYNEVEQIQREKNDQFDQLLDSSMRNKLKNLCEDIQATQSDVIRLQCDVAHAKDQLDTLKTALDSQPVQDRRELLKKEQTLEKSLRQSKFSQPKQFFDQFIIHLDASISTCGKLLTFASQHNYQHSFDWTQYHRVIFILRACGKAILDVNRLERLYQSECDFGSMTFKQILEKQIEVMLADETNKKVDLEVFLLIPNVQEILTSEKSIEFEMFRDHLERLSAITVNCCRVLVDLNLVYLEAQFTDGITIEKLNGRNDSENAAELDGEQALPLYAFSPQEYITQVGQHLLTLRKQTEQFDQIYNGPTRLALESLQYAQDIPLDVRACNSVTEIILKCIARHCIRSFVGRTTNSILSRLSQNGKRQLATDAMYLDNVLEDLRLLDSSEPYVDKFKSLFAQYMIGR